MKSKMKLMPLLVSVTLISGCTVLRGSNMSTMGKDVIKQQDADFDLDKMVNVYPLTPRLIDQLRPRPNVARPNMTLESEIANYQYRVGPGDVLNVTVWDHPDFVGVRDPVAVIFAIPQQVFQTVQLATGVI